MRKNLTWLSLISAFTLSCAGSDPDRCAFQAQDGSCAVTASSTGALECKLDDSALCSTVTAFVESRAGGAASSSSALIDTGATVGGLSQLRLSRVCEPDGTFMCTCCSVKAGCYPCPKN
ncbi:MAG TPA: hypothetical protein VJV79_37445 [Polyangiaceae bacterium]|nr:hypothetical protein [Polyangiaceae bacterium]